MTHVSKSLSSDALRLAMVGTLLLSGAWVSAQETPPQSEPQAEAQATEAQPAQTEAQPEAPSTLTPTEAEPLQETRASRVYRSSWKIIVEGKAETNGVLSFVIEPTGGTPTLVKLNVLAKSKKKDIAKELAKQFTFAAGATYKVKAGGNSVKIKVTSKKQAPFFLGIETQAVNGVSVRLTKG